MATQGDKIGKNANLVEQAVSVLRQLADQAERNSMFGTVGVELSYQGGVAHKIRRQFNETLGNRKG